MANTPTTVKDDTPAVRKPFGKTSNPTNLVFPLDTTGFTTTLRKEGARAVGRINGDTERLEVFIATLRVLGDHAKTKLEAQKDARAAALKQAEALASEAAARARQDELNEITRLEKLLDDTAAALDAKRPAVTADE